MGRWGSLRLTNKLSHFRSKWTIFFECKYSIPKAASMAIISFLRRSSDLLNVPKKSINNSGKEIDELKDMEQNYLSFLSRTCRSDPFTINSVTVANVPPAPSGTTP